MLKDVELFSGKTMGAGTLYTAITKLVRRAGSSRKRLKTVSDPIGSQESGSSI